jgi:hypothetical protein
LYFLLNYIAGVQVSDTTGDAIEYYSPLHK